METFGPLGFILLNPNVELLIPMKPDTWTESLLNRGGDVLAAGAKK